MYALSCNLSDAGLAGRLDLLARGPRAASAEAPEEEGRAEGSVASGSGARLTPWKRRRARDLGEAPAEGGAPLLIDRVHKLMQLWKAGEQSRVDACLESQGLWRHELFARVVQVLIEPAEGGSEERATLESIQNHVRTRGGASAHRQESLRQAPTMSVAPLHVPRIATPPGTPSTTIRRIQRHAGYDSCPRHSSCYRRRP